MPPSQVIRVQGRSRDTEVTSPADQKDTTVGARDEEIGAKSSGADVPFAHHEEKTKRFCENVIVRDQMSETSSHTSSLWTQLTV
jgi:hypothetical protein